MQGKIVVTKIVLAWLNTVLISAVLTGWKISNIKTLTLLKWQTHLEPHA